MKRSFNVDVLFNLIFSVYHKPETNACHLSLRRHIKISYIFSWNSKIVTEIGVWIPFLTLWDNIMHQFPPSYL